MTQRENPLNKATEWVNFCKEAEKFVQEIYEMQRNGPIEVDDKDLTAFWYTIGYAQGLRHIMQEHVTAKDVKELRSRIRAKNTQRKFMTPGPAVSQGPAGIENATFAERSAPLSVNGFQQSERKG